MRKRSLYAEVIRGKGKEAEKKAWNQSQNFGPNSKKRKRKLLTLTHSGKKYTLTQRACGDSFFVLDCKIKQPRRAHTLTHTHTAALKNCICHTGTFSVGTG